MAADPTDAEAPSQAASVDDQREDYDRIWDEMSQTDYTRQQHFKNRIHAVKTLLRQIGADDPSILEIGCGFGSMSGEIAPFGRVTGTDLSPRGIEIARRNHPDLRFFHADVLTHDFGGEQFDIVVCSEVLEHIEVESRDRFIGVLAERVRPGGHLILTTPNKALSDSISTFQLIEEHLTPDELRALVEPHFEVLQLSTIHRVFPILGHRSKLFQVLRVAIYEGLRARPWLENPLRPSDRGLYTVLLGRRR